MKPEVQNTKPAKITSSTVEQNISTDLDPKLAKVFLPWLLRYPRYLKASFRLMRAVKRTKKSRDKALKNGLKVPPFLILSITSQCNLHCTGCFAAAAGNISNRTSKSKIQTKPQLNKEQWRAIITEAAELGVMGFIIAGGEPFLFPGLLELCEEFKNRFFLILTNGTALTPADYKRLKRSSNIAILVSIEGDTKLTNLRRGQGVYERAFDTLKRLSKIGVPNGISVTITRLNYKYWMKNKNIDNLVSQGIRLGSFIEYIPTSTENDPKNPDHSSTPCSFIPTSLDDTTTWSDKNMNELMLSAQERARFRKFILNYRKSRSIYLIHSPGDEEFFGGCVSAGRGFAHVTPAGDLTPCPVSNIATHNLSTATLHDGLASPLFKEIRKSEHLLENEGTPCALFAHPKEVDELAKAVGAYRTDVELK